MDLSSVLFPCNKNIFLGFSVNFKDWKKEIKILLAEIGENQSWLADELDLTRQDVSQKLRAKKLNFEFYQEAMKKIKSHPRFSATGTSIIGDTHIENGESELVFKTFKARIDELQSIVLAQAKEIGKLEERVKWLGSKSK